MSFDPTSVLHNIRSRKNQMKQNILESSVSHHEKSVEKYEKSRDENLAQSTIHIMAEQIRSMQDHIRRLESQLSEANTEIHRLRLEKDQIQIEAHRQPSVSPAVPSKQKKKEPSQNSKTGIPTKKSNESFGQGTQRATLEDSRHENLHTNSRDTLLPVQSGYLGLYVSNKSKESADHSSIEGPVSRPRSNYNSKSDLRVSSLKEAEDLRLDILEKIIRMDANIGVPHVNIDFKPQRRIH